MYDVIIVGAGPAGVSASLYTKRAGLNTLIIGKDLGALEKTEKIQNYYGTESVINGIELAKRGIKQAEALGVMIYEEEVIQIDYDENYKVITNKNTYFAKAVILATGTKRVSPQITGLDKYEGKGISYCATCDAFFYRKKDVAVLGNGNYAINEAMHLLPIVKSVTMLTNGKPSKEFRSEQIKINEKPVREFRGDASLENVTFTDDSMLEVSGVFIAEGTASSVDFARKLGVETRDNQIIVNESMQTNLPGLYAAGDCTGGLLQIAKAVYEGAKAGTEIIKYVRNKN